MSLVAIPETIADAFLLQLPSSKEANEQASRILASVSFITIGEIR